MILKSTKILFDEYYRYQDATNPKFNKDAAAEAGERLEQLDRILSKVNKLEAESEKYIEYTKSVLDRVHAEAPDFTDSRTWNDELKALYQTLSDSKRNQERLAVNQELMDWTEAFYYFAFRARQLLRLLPGVKNFECVGVRDVRNHLIEHPEKQSKVFLISFGWGGASGPAVKALRVDDQKDIFVDKGLYVNAQEFKEDLERRLRAVIQ